jgi:ethanolamine utilization protein EutN
MILCRVKGSIISTRKNDRLKGCKFLIVEALDQSQSFVAVDNIGAGVGERVMVVQGSSARLACTSENTPIDAAIIGIIDEGTYEN